MPCPRCLGPAGGFAVTAPPTTTAPRTTPLDALHRELGARMVPFAGYSMPVQYPAGILAEHAACRESCALFDVSHMGQAFVHGDGAAAALEGLCPGSLRELKPGRQRYTVLTNDDGGILDDLMVTNCDGHKMFVVVNAACKDADFARIAAHLDSAAGLDGAAGTRLEVLEGRALLALQGPRAAHVMAHFAPASAHMVFMDAGPLTVAGIPCFVTRSGYTGEDGFEISVAADQAEALARHFLEMDDCHPAGLGARDSLRLEAGLPLYGSDIDAKTSPVEAGLGFAIGKRRRTEGGFPGAARILAELDSGVSRRRVGIKPVGRAPARAHTEIRDTADRIIGEITSGGFGPTVGGPIAMGYVAPDHTDPGTPVVLMVRGKPVDAHVVALPFVTQRYHRG